MNFFSVPEIEPEELKRLMEAPNQAVVIDCREEDEWELCRIEGARHVPLSRFPEKVGEALAAVEDGAPVVVYCAHGFRSMRAAKYLQGRGVRNVASLRGGLKAWADKFDPAMPVD